jgi:signal transduction histidine kinase
MRRVEAGDVGPGEGEIEVPPRTLHWLNLPVLSGETPQGRLLVFRDVTEQRLLEKMRDDLTRTMVHDLRNPLGSIYTSLILLEEDSLENLSATQRRMLEIARNNTERMLRLVNDILDVSKLESGRMQLQHARVSLPELISGIMQAQSPLASSKRLQLQSDVPPDLPAVWADPALVERVLQNLVDNAIKFTPDGGSVKITVQPYDQETTASGHIPPAHLLISVSDSGPGIPQDLRDRLFQKFVTGRQKESGSGLGLAFCKLVVEAHRGHIWVESAPEMGTTFSFTLPVARET